MNAKKEKGGLLRLEISNPSRKRSGKKKKKKNVVESWDDKKKKITAVEKI